MTPPTAIQDFTLLIARILYSPIFIISGIGKATHFAQNVTFLTDKGLPFPEVMLILAIIFELGGSILVLIGYKARLGAVMLFIFIIIATLMVHNFWDYPAEEASNQISHFLKNLSIMGGALFIIIFGPGHYSFGIHKEKA